MYQTIWRCIIVWRLLCVYCLVSTDTYAQTPKTITQNLPDQWPKQDLKRYLTLQNGFDQQSRKYIHLQKSADNANGMIAGTSEPFAVHAGLEILKHGGNAADAALTTALAQVALTTGAAISYAGILNAVYYDAASHRVYTLNAAYNTVRNEKDPRSIPGWGEHSGRSALIPGFMAGVQALHDRFGKLPFPTLFGPAIWIADNGVLISPVVGGWISSQKDFITRIPETKRIFAKPDGQLYKTGDVFRQPELASTLKEIAALGSTYMYKGAWAHHFVELDRREGGKMTLEDLEAYRPVWTAPLQVSYGDYQAVSLGPPNVGGAITLGSLKLAGIANLKKYGNYAASAEALYYLIQIERATASFASESASVRRKSFPDIDPSPASLLNRSLAERLWTQILGKTIPTRGIERYRPNHSAGILAIDEQGNVACIVHSLNGVLWGATGIFVDGISIPDSASFQQDKIAEVGPGVRLPDATNPVIVLKGGKPVLASSAVGSGLLNVTLENLLNILDFDMDPETAVSQPNTQGPVYGMPSLHTRPVPELEKEAMGGGFSKAVLEGLEARGQAIKLSSQQGYWIGIQIDPRNHNLKGAVTSALPALVEGY